MAKMTYEYPIRTGITEDLLSGVIVETAVAAVCFTGKLWRKLLDYAKSPPEDRNRELLIMRYGGLIGHIYDMLILRGCARATAKRYADVFAKFIAWVGKHALMDFTEADVQAFLDHRLEEIRAAASNPCETTGLMVYRMYLYALRKILDECLKLDLTVNIKVPPHVKPIKPAKKEVVQTISNQTVTYEDLIAFVLVNCIGLRPGVAVNLTWDNFSDDFRYVTFDTAYGEKIVNTWPFSDALSELKRQSGHPEGTVLSALDCKTSRGITVRTLQYRLERLLAACKIKEWVTLTALQKAEAILPEILAAFMRGTA